MVKSLQLCLSVSHSSPYHPQMLTQCLISNWRLDEWMSEALRILVIMYEQLLGKCSRDGGMSVWRMMARHQTPVLLVTHFDEATVLSIDLMSTRWSHPLLWRQWDGAFLFLRWMMLAAHTSANVHCVDGMWWPCSVVTFIFMSCEN